MREADDAVRQAALDDEETRKRRELRAQRSKATDFFANPEDVTPQANEPSSWAGSQFANHLTLRGPETYSRAEIHASNERDRIERERRQVDPCEGRCQRRAEVRGQRAPAAGLHPAVRRRNSARKNSARKIRRAPAAAILSDASPTARLQARQPDARRWPPARAASGAVRAHRQRDRSLERAVAAA